MFVLQVFNVTLEIPKGFKQVLILVTFVFGTANILHHITQMKTKLLVFDECDGFYLPVVVMGRVIYGIH